jgi:thymidylate synthase (FAD)
MKIIEQSVEIIHMTKDPLDVIEFHARNCYQSEDRIKEGSAAEFVGRLIQKEHHSPLEFADMTVRFITSRKMTHEFVRHRLCSFTQESTRYCVYDEGITLIRPVWWNDRTDIVRNRWLCSMNRAEEDYLQLLAAGLSAQEASDALPHAVKAQIDIKANFREWLHMLKVRTHPAAHPQMKALMWDLLRKAREVCPVIFSAI